MYSLPFGVLSFYLIIINTALKKIEEKPNQIKLLACSNNLTAFVILRLYRYLLCYLFLFLYPHFICAFVFLFFFPSRFSCARVCKTKFKRLFSLSYSSQCTNCDMSSRKTGSQFGLLVLICLVICLVFSASLSHWMSYFVMTIIACQAMSTVLAFFLKHLVDACHSCQLAQPVPQTRYCIPWICRVSLPICVCVCVCVCDSLSNVWTKGFFRSRFAILFNLKTLFLLFHFCFFPCSFSIYFFSQ